MLDTLVTPFTDYAFMRRALAACCVLALGSTPLGFFMTLRRMSLMGDAVSHAILPGIAAAFLLAGLNIWFMTLGGVLTGIFVALATTFLSRRTALKDDASFTLLYLLCLAAGITMISMRGNSNIDLVHILFGNILGLDEDTLKLIMGAAILNLFFIAINYRELVIDSFDPDYRAAMKPKSLIKPLFFVLVVTNLVAAFQALGTLMALGLFILPAFAARFWVCRVDGAILFSMAAALVASFAGLLVSYHFAVPTGPAIVLSAGLICLVSAAIGPHGSLRVMR